MERIIAFSMERVIAFSIEHVLVQNMLQFLRNFGVPAAFHFAFHLRSSNAFSVKLLLSGTVDRINSYLVSSLKHDTCSFYKYLSIVSAQNLICMEGFNRQSENRGLLFYKFLSPL